MTPSSLSTVAPVLVERVTDYGFLYVREPGCGWTGLVTTFDDANGGHCSFNADGLTEREIVAVLEALRVCAAERRVPKEDASHAA